MDYEMGKKLDEIISLLKIVSENTTPVNPVDEWGGEDETSDDKKPDSDSDEENPLMR